MHSYQNDEEAPLVAPLDSEPEVSISRKRGSGLFSLPALVVGILVVLAVGTTAVYMRPTAVAASSPVTPAVANPAAVIPAGISSAAVEGSIKDLEAQVAPVVQQAPPSIDHSNADVFEDDHAETAEPGGSPTIAPSWYIPEPTPEPTPEPSNHEIYVVDPRLDVPPVKDTPAEEWFEVNELTYTPGKWDGHGRPTAKPHCILISDNQFDQGKPCTTLKVCGPPAHEVDINLDTLQANGLIVNGKSIISDIIPGPGVQIGIFESELCKGPVAIFDTSDLPGREKTYPPLTNIRYTLSGDLANDNVKCIYFHAKKLNAEWYFPKPSGQPSLPPTAAPFSPTELPSLAPTLEPTLPAEEPAGPAEEPAGPAEEPAGPAEEPAGPAEEPAGPAEEPAAE